MLLHIHYKLNICIHNLVSHCEARLFTGSPSLLFVLRDLYIYKDFVWELRDRVIYKTLYGNPLDFSKIYDIFMNDKIKLTYLLFSVYLSVLCSLRPFGAIWSDLSTVSISYWGNLTVDKSLQMAQNGLKLRRTDKYTLNKR